MFNHLDRLGPMKENIIYSIRSEELERNNRNNDIYAVVKKNTKRGSVSDQILICICFILL